MSESVMHMLMVWNSLNQMGVTCMPWIMFIVMNVMTLKCMVWIIMMHIVFWMTVMIIGESMSWKTFWVVISLMMCLSSSMLMDM